MTSPICPSPLFHLTKPFTRRSLDRIKVALSAPRPDFTIPKAPREAAVLIPLCNVRNTPGILFEVRAKLLRTHSGEVSFPGGRMDPSDPNHIAAALRETHEELGISMDKVEILGDVGPPQVNLRGDMVVWPFVGFIHSNSPHSTTSFDDDPLPSCDLSSIRASSNQAEVDTVFHLPFAEITSQDRLRASFYRGNRPYWTVGVSDIVENDEQVQLSTGVEVESDDSEVGPGRFGKLEVWGLSGWYLNLLMRRLEMCQ